MRCVYVGVFACAHTGEGGKKGGEEERKRGKGRDRELPDLKRQIRTSLKSITGKLVGKRVQLKGCKRILMSEID